MYKGSPKINSMKNNPIFSSWWFLFGLSMLLVNDFILKDLYGNWLTGKLSDFSGLFVFSLFWTALFPKYRLKIMWLTGIMFVYWKSSYSQAFINTWNQFDILPIDRVVDYSDYLALLILPLANSCSKSLSTHWKLKISPIIPLLLSAFSFMATSYRSNVDINKEYHLPYPKDTVIQRLVRLDSLQFEHQTFESINQLDTIEFDIFSSHCFSRFKVQISVLETPINTCKLMLLTANHRCPSEKDDKAKILNEFEVKIIDRIRQLE